MIKTWLYRMGWLDMYGKIDGGAVARCILTAAMIALFFVFFVAVIRY